MSITISSKMALEIEVAKAAIIFLKYHSFS